ncbi:hypothetical protein MRX96_049859 [Rhipicephalus microplus]
MENSCFGDDLVKHGIKHNGRDYLEERLYRKDGTSVSFYFLTKIYSGYVERILADMAIDSAPDVIIASSCLWDITRWGPNGVVEYKANLNLFFGHLNRILPSTSLVIWLTAAPLGSGCPRWIPHPAARLPQVLPPIPRSRGQRLLQEGT